MSRKEGLPKDAFRVYLRKAEDFGRAMVEEQQKSNPNSAGLAAIHCAISACDALCVFHLGERSRGQSHHDAVALVGRLPVPEAGRYVLQFAEVLSHKNAVEYEARSLSHEDAGLLVKRAERLLGWAKKNLP